MLRCGDLQKKAQIDSCESVAVLTLVRVPQGLIDYLIAAAQHSS